jgi:hypothetical protein
MSHVIMMHLQILSQICLIATGKDFPLNAGENATNEFGRLKHPGSFRACLCQISDEGYWAFLEADQAMKAINIDTSKVSWHS